MKKNNVVEIVILGVLGALVLLTLVIPQLFRERNEPRLLSLSVLLRDTDSSGWTVARQGMEQAADELGAELRFLTLTVQNDSREQEELLRREVEGGADALIAVPADPEALRTAMGQLSAACPLVTMECAIENGDGVVAPDNEQVGRRLAQALLEDWDGGLILLLDNSAACPEAALRLKGAFDALAQAEGEVPVLVLDYGYWDSLRGARWVMTFEPGATLQTAEWKQAEEETFALYGVGSSTAVTVQLERGNIAAIAAWSDYAAGYLAVQQAVQAVQQRPRALEPLPFSIIRGEDIYAPENQKLLFPVMSSSGR